MTNSKSILFITVGTEITASSRVRVYNYKSLLEKEGFLVRIMPYNNAADARANARNERRPLVGMLLNKANHFVKAMRYLCIAPAYDIIYIQRVLLPKGVFKMLKSLGKKIIFDLDDAIYLSDRYRTPFLIKNKFIKRFQYILKGSDCVITSNEELKKEALKFNANVIILPTPVDTDRFSPKPSRNFNGKIVIGWIGTTWSTKYIEPLKDTFEELARRYQYIKLELVGAAPLEGWKADVSATEWRLETEAEKLQNFDIGIMPLITSPAYKEWSLGKGGYKLIQYMAAGVPCVASPISSSRAIIDEGATGFLVDTKQEWLEKLSVLIENKGLRDKMGQEGRRKAERLYSYGVIAPKLISILESLA